VRRFVSLAFLLFFTVPFGLSVIGCGHKSAPPIYCNGGDSGPVVGQVYTISLSPNLALIGESLNYGQIGAAMNATAQDCQHNSVSVSKFTYATTDTTLMYADVNPANGEVCAGHWNRNLGSGIPDFTVCTPPSTPPPTNEYFITAQAGATSNPIPVFVHSVVTAVELAPSAALTNSCSTDPTTDCCSYNSVTAPEAPADPYDATVCESQNKRMQLTAKILSNGSNITCQVGHLTYSAIGATNVVSIDPYGFATANQPGSATITATIANSSSSSNAGYFATCPPASIALSASGQYAGQNPIDVSLNNAVPLTATVLDTKGAPITGISLEYNSTTPQTISASSGSILPTFPGSATITAVCQPGSCNPSPLSQVGYNGNGKPITSNGITVNTAGSSSTVLYMGSTNSQYLVPVDFTLNQQGAPIKLPFVPNSMVMSLDGTEIYLGSPQGLMTLSTASNTVSGPNQTIPGTVLAVSPDGSTVVVTDPTRQTVSLVVSGAVSTSYGNLVGTSAQWSPDSQTVYITTTTNTLLTHSTFNNWQVATTNETYKDVAVMVPSIGAYFSGQTTEGRSYCSVTTIATPASNGNPPTTNNAYFPLADTVAVNSDVLAATTDSQHILTATAGTTPATLSDIKITLPPPTAGNAPQACTTATGAVSFTSSAGAPVPLSNITASAITGVDPESNSDLAFVTYTGSGGVLPFYVPSTGALSYVTLSSGATAPVAGVFSTDNLTFYVGTAGDNQVHLITVNGTTATESGKIVAPQLPAATGSGYATPNLIAQHPKKLQAG
jgi:trimeric autotransporter adhesin